MRLRSFILALVVSLPLSLLALEGDSTLGVRVHKYLLDNDQNADHLFRSEDVSIEGVGAGQYVLRNWKVAGLAAPTEATLDTAAEASAVVRAPPNQRKKVNGKWVLKTQGEIDSEFAASPEGVLKAKRVAVRTSLVSELTSAGFTNAPPFTTDDIQVWMETATLQANVEKKINRLLSRYQALTTKPPRVDAE